MAKDLNKVTTTPIILPMHSLGKCNSITLDVKFLFPDNLENLHDGTYESDCPLPCEIFSTETKLTKIASTKDSALCVLNLQQDVEVKSSKVKQEYIQSFYLSLYFILYHTCR